MNVLFMQKYAENNKKPNFLKIKKVWLYAHLLCFINIKTNEARKAKHPILKSEEMLL